MITDNDRTYYFGCSDTHYIMSKFDTKTFQNWWRIKIGVTEDYTDTIYTRAGNLYEQPILDALFIPYRNEQIIIGQLRANLDGRTDEMVVEVKTHQSSKPFKVTKAYWQQVQVEMYATWLEKCLLVAYGLNEEDYETLNEIDIDRIETFEVEYDQAWIENEYLPRFHYLCECMESEVTPSESEFNLYRARESV